MTSNVEKDLKQQTQLNDKKLDLGIGLGLSHPSSQLEPNYDLLGGLSDEEEEIVQFNETNDFTYRERSELSEDYSTYSDTYGVTYRNVPVV